VEQWAKSRPYYDYRLGGKDRVAGLITQVIEILPKDEHRFGYRLWIDRDSGLLLRSMLRDHREQALEQISFTDIDITDDISDEELSAADTTKKFFVFPTPTAGDSHALKGDPEWVPTNLPPGFALIAHSHIDGDEHSKSTLEHMIYSDGLASVSIYIEQVTGENTGVPAQAKRGGIRVFSRRSGSTLITAIGELPYQTLAKIGHSVRRHDDVPHDGE